MRVIIATQNPHKVEEIKDIAKLFTDKKIDFVPIDNSLDFNPIEDGETFEENSLIKARTANYLTKEYTLADDSGLCVEALNGAPGIHSARYADTPQARIDKLLNTLKNTQNRNAKFVCTMTLINPQGEVIATTTGECKGEIAHSASGINGFGYDPVFIVSGTNRTMAEMSENEKNQLSHRSLALQKILKIIESI